MFNESFTDIEPSLARKIFSPSKPFERFSKKASATLPERYLNINELKDAFFSLKMNKSTGAEKISFNVTKNAYFMVKIFSVVTCMGILFIVL